MAATGDERYARRLARNEDSLAPAEMWPDRDDRSVEPPADRVPEGEVIELGEVDVSDEVSVTIYPSVSTGIDFLQG